MDKTYVILEGGHGSISLCFWAWNVGGYVHIVFTVFVLWRIKFGSQKKNNHLYLAVCQCVVFLFVFGCVFLHGEHWIEGCMSYNLMNITDHQNACHRTNIHVVEWTAPVAQRIPKSLKGVNLPILYHFVSSKSQARPILYRHSLFEQIEISSKSWLEIIQESKFHGACLKWPRPGSSERQRGEGALKWLHRCRERVLEVHSHVQTVSMITQQLWTIYN